MKQEKMEMGMALENITKVSHTLISNPQVGKVIYKLDHENHSFVRITAQSLDNFLKLAY